MIRDKINKIISEKNYRFCGITFDLYTDKDKFIIYDSLENKNKLYETIIDDYEETDRVLEMVTQNASKEELMKLDDYYGAPYAVCFYLGKPKEIVEGPISARVSYGGNYED